MSAQMLSRIHSIIPPYTIRLGPISQATPHLQGKTWYKKGRRYLKQYIKQKYWEKAHRSQSKEPDKNPKLWIAVNHRLDAKKSICPLATHRGF